MAATQKLCTVCRTDVAGKKRIKDPRGHYYCEPCYESRATTARQSAKQTTQSSSHASGASATVADPPVLEDLPALDDPAFAGETSEASASPPPPAPADDGLLDLAPERKPQGAKIEQLLGCSRCRKLLPEKQIRNVDGEFVCAGCLANETKPGGKKTAGLKPTKKGATAQKEENAERFSDTLVGGLAVAGGTLVASFFILLALYYFLPEPGYAGFFDATIFAFIQTVFVAFRAAALVISMIVAGRLLGGISFGYIGAAIYKSLAIFLVYTVAQIFMDRNESFSMLGLGFKGMLFIIAFIAVFRIDFFEAIILSVINFFLSMGLSVAMLAMIAIVLGGVSHQLQSRHGSDPAATSPDAADTGDAGDLGAN